MIAITYALPSESQPLHERFRHTGETEHPQAVLGNLGLHECLLVHTGIGPERARFRLRPVLDDPRLAPSLLISAGYAGALSPDLPAGALFLAENRSSPQLCGIAKDFLQSAGYSVYSGQLVSVPRPLELPEEKRALRKSSGAAAVDMETEVIAALCREREVPMLSLRVISDNATDLVPVPFAVCIDETSGKPRIAAIAQHLMLHPWRIPAFLQFAKNATRSRATLSEAIAALIPSLHSL